MAYAINWVTKVITIPTTDLTLVAGNRYSLDMSDFLDEIRRLEWEYTDGLWAPAILDHTNTKVDFAGANYAPFDEIINDYVITFSGSATRVDLIGSNNNIVDYYIAIGVSLVPSNSAGLQIVGVGTAEDVAIAVWDADKASHNDADSMGELQQADSSLTEQDKLDISDRVWDETLADHLTTGTTGKALSDAGSAGNPWDTPLTTSNINGTFGYLLQTTIIGYCISILNKIATVTTNTIKRVTGNQNNQI